MSASSKKKLRKEQNAATMTERQKNEQKEAKKLARMTVAFVLVMAIILSCGIYFAFLQKPIDNLINLNTVAVKIGDHEIGAVEFNYYYCDAVNDFCKNLEDTYGQQAALYAQWFYGIDFSRPLNKQDYDEKQTWGDYFVGIAKQNALSMYALYTKAKADPEFKLPDSDKESIEVTQQSLDLAASSLGYKNADAYVRSKYGPGANAESYKTYFEMNVIASSYYKAHKNSLKYEDADFREFEKDKYNDYTCYTYTSVTLGMTNYITTKEEPTETEQNEALAAAKKDADALIAGQYPTVEDFKKAVKALEINKETETIKTTQSKDTYFQNVTNKDVQTWLSNPERKAGDMTIIEAKNTTEDAEGKKTEKVVGYYVLFFEAERDNTAKMANVRHLLIKFSGGKTENGQTTYSKEEKEAALKKATDIFNEWKSGEKVDVDSFAALVKEKSEDTVAGKSNGGLIEDIHPESNLVQSFKDWALKSHQPGDTEIIESEYGYHIMYYVGDDELSLRDVMIKEDLTAEDMKKWLEETEKPYTMTDVNLKRVYFDYLP